MFKLPSELLVMLLAASPIAELRGAIPLGVGVFKMSIVYATFLSFVGNLLPIFLVYLVGGFWIKWTNRRKGLFQRLTDWVLTRSRKAFNSKYEKYGLIALPIFVAIPLPLTGVWTGAIAAFIFGIPLRRAFPLLTLGVLGAAVIVALAVSGTVSFLHFLVV